MVAIRLKSQRTYVSKFENGTLCPRPATFQRIARAIGVDLAEIINAAVAEHPPEIPAYMAEISGAVKSLTVNDRRVLLEMARHLAFKRMIFKDWELF